MNSALVIIGALALMAAESSAYAGYASSSSGSASSGNGNGVTYSSTGGYGPTFPYFPFPGFASAFIPPAAYGAAPFQDNIASVINDYLAQLQAANYNGGSFTLAAPGATATAGSFLGPQNAYQQAFLHHQALLNQAIQANGAGGYGGGAGTGSYGGSAGTGSFGGSGTGGSGVQFASATGSIGPGGYHQTASIYPASASSPNINNRFGGSSSSSPGGGYQGISTSSFASSSDVNGHKTGHREASTTINDNGKVTTYKVQS